jgi:hypothetical protein
MDTITLSLHVTPPPESGLLEQHFADIEVEPNSLLRDFALRESTLVTGQTFFPQEPPEGLLPVPATLHFRSLDGPDSLPPVETDEDGQFAMNLVPGNYQVTVLVDAFELPPVRVAELEVPSTTLVFNVPLPQPEDLYELTGWIVRQRPDSEVEDSDDLEVPVAGARVWLISETTAARVSTFGATDVDGAFTVRVLPTEGQYEIRVSPGENLQVPEVRLGPVEVSQSADLGVWIAGEWSDPVTVHGSVQGVNGDTVLLAQATVFFDRTIEAGGISRVTQTDEGGEFEITVIPGDYEVTLVPPADDDYGAATFEEETVAADSGDQNYDVTQKPELQGIVTGPSGMPIAGCLVTSEPIGYTVTSLSLSSASTVTDDDTGGYILPVHSGPQRVIVQPPYGIGLSPLIVSSVSISDENRWREFTLASARTVTGRVLVPDGTPLVGARIEVFVELPDELLRLVEVETDSTGTFTIELPVLEL